MSGRAKRVAIIGGGIAGVTAAWQLARLGKIEATLFEASSRLGGTVETIRREGFTMECGPDGWVSEKPWARELAIELGLEQQLIYSNDQERVTYILDHGSLLAMPDGMRMMVPTNLATLTQSPLFSEAAQRDYADEPRRAEALRVAAPEQDESVADFVCRHFGAEVLKKVGAPLLSGVFGGDVAKLSVQAVMPAFVQMEREHGSLIKALQLRAGKPQQPIFTSLSSGVGALADAMIREIPTSRIQYSTPVSQVSRVGINWRVQAGGVAHEFEAVIIAAPAHIASSLLRPLSHAMAELLQMEATSAVTVSLAFNQFFQLPKGFGFLVPSSESSSLLAATFVDQKFPERVPPGTRLLRAFFGGHAAPQIAQTEDEEISALALRQLRDILGPLPNPILSIVRRWPCSLPQYSVGHLERMAKLDELKRDHHNLWLLGNAYRGVGLPDLVRDARAAARELSST